MDNEKVDEIKREILSKLGEVIDPEVGIDIVNLGLIYGVDVDLSKGVAVVSMTMTTPACPLLGVILKNVEDKLSEVKSIDKIHIDLVWDPPWTPDRMSEKAKEQLGYV